MAVLTPVLVSRIPTAKVDAATPKRFAKRTQIQTDYATPRIMSLRPRRKASQAYSTDA